MTSTTLRRHDDPPTVAAGPLLLADGTGVLHLADGPRTRCGDPAAALIPACLADGPLVGCPLCASAP